MTNRKQETPAQLAAQPCYLSTFAKAYHAAVGLRAHAEDRVQQARKAKNAAAKDARRKRQPLGDENGVGAMKLLLTMEAALCDEREAFRLARRVERSACLAMQGAASLGAVVR